MKFSRRGFLIALASLVSFGILKPVVDSQVESSAEMFWRGDFPDYVIKVRRHLALKGLSTEAVKVVENSGEKL